MAARKKAPAKRVTKRTSFKLVEITIEGRDNGHLGEIIGETFAMARQGLTGTFTVNGIRAEVKVERG